MDIFHIDVTLTFAESTRIEIANDYNVDSCFQITLPLLQIDYT